MLNETINDKRPSFMYIEYAFLSVEGTACSGPSVNVGSTTSYFDFAAPIYPNFVPHKMMEW